MFKKISLFSVFLLFVGCASNSDIDKLKCDISELQVKQEKLQQVVEQNTIHIEKCELKMKNCEKHCSDFNSKLDKVFKKSQQK